MKLLATIHQYDVTMFAWFMARKRLALFSRVARWVSRSGDGPLYALLAVCLYAAGTPTERLFLLAAVTAFALERPLYFVLKNSFKRNRPQEALAGFRSFIKPSDRFSFPSGHTSAAFLMATLAALIYPALALPAFIWAAAVGLSRIFLGVHFPTDVLIGMGMGTGMALLSLGIIAA